MIGAGLSARVSVGNGRILAFGGTFGMDAFARADRPAFAKGNLRDAPAVRRYDNGGNPGDTPHSQVARPPVRRQIDDPTTESPTPDAPPAPA